MSNDERLLPTVNRLIGTEVIRVVGADGKRMLMPLSTLMEAAEARFATNAQEAGLLASCWKTIYAQRDDIAVLTARVLVLEAKPTPATVDLAPLTARVATLEARPVVSTTGLATQASVNTVASTAATNAADIAAMRTALNSLTARVTALEGEIKLKKDK